MTEGDAVFRACARVAARHVTGREVEIDRYGQVTLGGRPIGTRHRPAYAILKCLLVARRESEEEFERFVGELRAHRMFTPRKILEAWMVVRFDGERLLAEVDDAVRAMRDDAPTGKTGA